MRKKLTAIITTFNEADNIEHAINSVLWMDEIIVVDSYSTDQTVEIAGNFPVTLYQRAYSGPSDQKNWAIPKASHEWVFILDADERITDDLKKELTSWQEDTTAQLDGYWVPRQNYFLGRPIRYSGWQNDAVIRLIHRDKCRYNSKQVHEEIETAGLRIGRLKSKLDHFTYKNISHFLDKMNRYAAWSAKDHAAKTSRITYFHLFLKPFFRFFKHFFWQKGLLDGKRGFIISVLLAWGVFLRYTFMFESKKKK